MKALNFSVCNGTNINTNELTQVNGGNFIGKMWEFYGIGDGQKWKSRVHGGAYIN